MVLTLEQRARKTEYQRRWRADNPERIALYRERHHPSQRKYALKKYHGITIDDYNAILAVQGNVCGACGRPKTKANFVVDHDHKDGKIRGVIHHSCNFALSVFDDKTKFRRFMFYMRRSKDMAAKGIRISRVTQYFREADFDEARVAFTIVKEIMEARMAAIKSQAKATEQGGTRKPRKPRGEAASTTAATTTTATAAS